MSESNFAYKVINKSLIKIAFENRQLEFHLNNGNAITIIYKVLFSNLASPLIFQIIKTIRQNFPTSHAF